MKKIPTMFERDWTGDRVRVVNQVHEDCEWVMAGEGVATRMVDGTCCLVRDGKLYKRRELGDGDAVPAGFEEIDHDVATGTTVGWMPVGDGPEDRYHREAWEAAGILLDGTYELIGPNVQGNPERARASLLVQHGDGTAGPIKDVPRTFEGLGDWLAGRDIEGIVFRHEDGRMAKIKLRDFGLRRTPQSPGAEMVWVELRQR
jgi:hypothetical protein